MKTVVITSGFFNPLHPGHIECFKLCKELGDELRVIVNNDHQAKLKTGKDEIFQDEIFRLNITKAIKYVDNAVLAVDKDESVCESIRNTIKTIKNRYGEDTKVIFGKGGDRFASNIPEVKVCEELGIQIRDGLGSKTYNSSTYRDQAT